MTGHIKLLLSVLAIFGLFCMAGCEGDPEAVEQPLTKEEIKGAVKEGLREASQPGQFTKDALEAFEANKYKAREQMKGYTKEDRERKRVEAQKAYEESQKKKALEEAQKNN